MFTHHRELQPAVKLHQCVRNVGILVLFKLHRKMALFSTMAVLSIKWSLLTLWHRIIGSKGTQNSFIKLNILKRNSLSILSSYYE